MHMSVSSAGFQRLFDEKSDTTNLAISARGFIAITDGDVVFVVPGKDTGDEISITMTVTAGYVYAGTVLRIKSTGTTSTVYTGI